MTWPSIRQFLRIPAHLTGKDVAIAVVDGRFPNHPDLASHSRRSTYVVDTTEADPFPVKMGASDGTWTHGLHGLQAAAAAAGSGALSQGRYTGAAPDADLYLLQTGRFTTAEEVESKFVAALTWLSGNWRKYCIRGVVLTVSATRDTGYLPWQADPVRVRCEQLACDGLLVVVASGNTKELTCNGPASSPSALSVGGVVVPEDGDVRHAEPYHGCRGRTFEGKRVPEVLAPAENVVLPTPFRSPEERQQHFTAPYDDLPEGYARTEGTSFAGPIALGCAACIWQAQPEWSADQVKAAMVSGSEYNRAWEQLKAGLVHPAAAVWAEPRVDAATKPYAVWRGWKDIGDLARLEAMRGYDEETAVSAILSFCEETISRGVAEQIAALCAGRSAKVRAAAITALTRARAETVQTIDLRGHLRDDNCYVRMAALFALSGCPDVWGELASELVERFSDPDLNIRYCAMKLASKLNDRMLVEPLVSGLYEDAMHMRVSTFWARVSALEAMTGVSFEPVPEWRDGQCTYSEDASQARIYIAQKWNEWYNARDILDADIAAKTGGAADERF